MEETLCLIKPESLNHSLAIKKFIEEKSCDESFAERYKWKSRSRLRVSDIKVETWDRENIEKIYGEDLPEKLLKEYTDRYDEEDFLGDRCLIMKVEGEEARQRLEDLKGPLNASDYVGTDTLRGKFGLPEKYDKQVIKDDKRYTISLNGCHASDPEKAERELDLLFF